MAENLSPTKLDYFDDMFKLQSSSTLVSSFLSDDGRQTLVLDSTIFHPQGGGQPSDKGSISSAQISFIVEDVRSKDKIVYHYGRFLNSKDGNFEKGAQVFLSVDEDRRRLNSSGISTLHAVFISIMSLYFVFWSELFSDQNYSGLVTFRHSSISTFSLGAKLIVSFRMIFNFLFASTTLVNGVVEKTREKNKISIGEATNAIGIPRMLIDIRHEGSHRDLPSLQLVRLSATKALDWLISYYWEPQEKALPVQNNKSTNLRKEIKRSLREVSVCLKAKQMSKLTSAHVKGKRSKNSFVWLHVLPRLSSPRLGDADAHCWFSSGICCTCGARNHELDVHSIFV